MNKYELTAVYTCKYEREMKNYQGIPECDVIGEGVYSRFLELPLRSPGLEKSPNPPDIFPNVASSGGGWRAYSLILNLAPMQDIRHETCQNSEVLLHREAVEVVMYARGLGRIAGSSLYIDLKIQKNFEVLLYSEAVGAVIYVWGFGRIPNSSLYIGLKT